MIHIDKTEIPDHGYVDFGDEPRTRLHRIIIVEEKYAHLLGGAKTVNIRGKKYDILDIRAADRGQVAAMLTTKEK